MTTTTSWSSSGLSSTTLHVSDIPGSVDNAQLEDAFADFGPLKRCFVVKKKSGVVKEEPDKLYTGYIEFAVAEDARQCIEETKGAVQVRSIRFQGLPTHIYQSFPSVQVQSEGKLVKLGLSQAKERRDPRAAWRR